MMVFLWLVFAAFVGVLANSRGRGWFTWLLIALVISPLIAAVALLVMSNPKQEEFQRKLLEATRQNSNQSK